MHTTLELIDTYMNQIDDQLLFNMTCEVIKAYEGKNLPVPIRKIYLSFSGEENKVTYFTDESGVKMETNDIVIRMNSFVPLDNTPSSGQLISEIAGIFLALSNEGITGFNVGDIVFDSNVDAYRITSRIYFSETEKVETKTA